jgi:hypothetical protein
MKCNVDFRFSISDCYAMLAAGRLQSAMNNLQLHECLWLNTQISIP